MSSPPTRWLVPAGRSERRLCVHLQRLPAECSAEGRRFPRALVFARWLPLTGLCRADRPVTSMVGGYGREKDGQNCAGGTGPCENCLSKPCSCQAGRDARGKG